MATTMQQLALFACLIYIDEQILHHSKYSLHHHLEPNIHIFICSVSYLI